MENTIINVPASKSVAHRALICGALSKTSLIKNIGENDDIKATLNCLKAMGFDFIQDGQNVQFTGFTQKLEKYAHCNESGSTLRFLTPIVSALGIDIIFTGDGRLMDRPMSTYEECFKDNGASLTLYNKELSVKGKLTGGKYYIAGDVSSQFITGLLLALPLLESDSEIIITTNLESKPYVDITLDVLTSFGIIVENNDYKNFKIKGNQTYKSISYTVEADYSSASFFIVAGALGYDVTVANLRENSLQGDKEILNLVKKAGAKITKTDSGINIQKNELIAFDCDVKEIPDLVPPLALLMSLCKGESKILNASRLRIKESDRLKTVSEQLNKLGANITEYEDSLVINGVDSLTGGNVSGCNDHRIAMMCGIASLFIKEEVVIEGKSCVKKSYPTFWEDFEKVKL